MYKHILLSLAVIGVWLGWGMPSVSAQTPVPSDDAVNAVAKQLYCPVCENIPLDVCPTQACAQWRDLIRQKLAAGWSADQIKDYFVQQYGDRVLAEPPRRGLNWLVYVLPPLAILLGAAGVVLLLRRMRQPVGSTPASIVSPDVQGTQNDEYLKRIEAELNRRKKNQA